MLTAKDEHGDAQAALKHALLDLRLAYHVALLRRTMGTTTPMRQLHSWILDEDSDARIVERLRAAGSGQIGGVPEADDEQRRGIMTRLGRFMGRLRWPWRT